jgi:dehydrogenase/reductase SDR family member 7B
MILYFTLRPGCFLLTAARVSFHPEISFIFAANKRKFMNFPGKKIWITGASSGIGRAVAIELSKQKVHLVLSARNKQQLEEVASDCITNGSTADVVLFDLEMEESLAEAAQTVLSSIGAPDALYHFGGISQRSYAAETPLEIDRKIFEINFFGTIALTKAILPAMIQNGGGHIAVTSSIVGKFGIPYRSAYSASKHALHGFFESLRAENKKNNIRVSVIIPGRIRTNISVNALQSDGSKHGVMDEGQKKGKTAEATAEIICRKLKREQKEILTGGSEILMVYIRKYIPFLYYYLAPKVKPL